VDNPISIRQAFWSPYKKFVRMIEEQVSKRAAAADASAQDKLASAATAAANADKAAADAAKAEKAKAEEPKKLDIGVVAALGVAFGSVGTMAANAMGYLKTPGSVVLALVGLVAIISGPSMILAYIKLRKRNLGPILDANGWAVNSKAKINVPFGTSLTDIAKLPPGSTVDTTDTFAEKVYPWKRWVAIAAVVLFAFQYRAGKLDGVIGDYLAKPLRSGAVLGSWATDEAQAVEAARVAKKAAAETPAKVDAATNAVPASTK
jgi:hypothetical protein